MTTEDDLMNQLTMLQAELEAAAQRIAELEARISLLVEECEASRQALVYDGAGKYIAVIHGNDPDAIRLGNARDVVDNTCAMRDGPGDMT